MIQLVDSGAQWKSLCHSRVRRHLALVAICFLAVQAPLPGESSGRFEINCANVVETGHASSAPLKQLDQKRLAGPTIAFLDADHRNRNNRDRNLGASDTEQSRNEDEKRCADPVEDSSQKIRACTTLIESGQNDIEFLATAYMDRGNGYQDRGEYERAIQDYSQAILLEPKSELALYDRGNAYDSKGDYDRAIADYDQVIRLSPDGDHAYYAYYGRGYAYNAKGEFDRAIEDYDQAIRLNSEDANAFVVRGVANFLRANPFQAVIDLLRSSQLNPTSTYNLLWLHLAKKRLGQDDSKELIRRSAKVDLSKWPGPVLKLYLEKLTVDQLIKATASTDNNVESQQLCEANFFAGEDAMLRLHDTAARRLLQSASDACPLKNFHRNAAAAELRRLNASADSTKPAPSFR